MPISEQNYHAQQYKQEGINAKEMCRRIEK